MSRSRSHRRSMPSYAPIVAFLLIACFGLLFVGCSNPSDKQNDFDFSAEDAARFHQLAQQAEGSGAVEGSGGTAAGVALTGSAGTVTALTGTGATPVLDLSMVKAYDAIRSGFGPTGANLYRVINEYLTLRGAPDAGATVVERLNGGDFLTLTEFVNASWAKVKAVADGKEGYVSTRYIAKVTGADKLDEEKKAFAGQYYVNYAYVNVRKAADPKSDKIGQIPGQAIVRPLSVKGDWAQVSFSGSVTGYVSTQYLAPFLPNFFIRQETFALPVLLYDATQKGMLDELQQHVERLKQEKVAILTFRDFHDILVKQETGDARTPVPSVILAVTGVTAQDAKDVADVLGKENVPATLFIETKDVGISGITQKMLATLVADGMDIQSGSHSGDDLRALTNAQLELELTQSRQLLEENAGAQVYAVLYPAGGVNDRVLQQAQAAGYLFGVGNVPDRTFGRDQLLRMPSYAISGSMTPDDIVRIAKGS